MPAIPNSLSDREEQAKAAFVALVDLDLNEASVTDDAIRLLSAITLCPQSLFRMCGCLSCVNVNRSSSWTAMMESATGLT